MSALSTITWTGFLTRPGRARVPLLHRLRHWRRRAQERDEIAHLDERILRDIGLSEAEIGNGVPESFESTAYVPLYVQPGSWVATPTTRK